MSKLLEDFVLANKFEEYAQEVDIEEVSLGNVHHSRSVRGSALSAFKMARDLRVEISCQAPDKTTQEHLKHFASQQNIEVRLEEEQMIFVPVRDL